MNAISTTPRSNALPTALWASIADSLFAPFRPRRDARVTEDAAALMERADAYEATQPSYAADLRAAAQQVGTRR